MRLRLCADPPYRFLFVYVISTFFSCAGPYVVKVLLLSTYNSFVCEEVLRHNQPIGVMSSAVSLPIYTFTGQA